MSQSNESDVEGLVRLGMLKRSEEGSSLRLPTEEEKALQVQNFVKDVLGWDMSPEEAAEFLEAAFPGFSDFRDKLSADFLSEAKSE